MGSNFRVLTVLTRHDVDAVDGIGIPLNNVWHQYLVGGTKGSFVREISNIFFSALTHCLLPWRALIV
jgi:hypothetical protein